MKTNTVPSHPTALLRRPDLPSQDDLATITNTESVEYAGEELGYKHPKKLLARATSKLGTALRVTGIKPFDLQTVRDYKAHCIITKQGDGTNTLTGTVAKFIVDNRYNLEGFDTFFLVVSTIVATVGLATTIAGIITGFSLAWPISLLVSGSILIPICYKVRTQSRNWEWKTTKLDEYSGEVPKFALDTAKEIHMRAPQTKFYIEELVQTSTKRVVDPFLVARDAEDGSTSYHLEVWDEPLFDQTRRV